MRRALALPLTMKLVPFWSAAPSGQKLLPEGKLCLANWSVSPIPFSLPTMAAPIRTASSPARANPLLGSMSQPGLLLAAALLLMALTTPAYAQRCSTQNGQTICCDNSGNCYSK